MHIVYHPTMCHFFQAFSLLSAPSSSLHANTHLQLISACIHFISKPVEVAFSKLGVKKCTFWVVYKTPPTTWIPLYVRMEKLFRHKKLFPRFKSINKIVDYGEINILRRCKIIIFSTTCNIHIVSVEKNHIQTQWSYLSRKSFFEKNGDGKALLFWPFSSPVSDRRNCFSPFRTTIYVKDSV